MVSLEEREEHTHAHTHTHTYRHRDTQTHKHTVVSALAVCKGLPEVAKQEGD